MNLQQIYNSEGFNKIYKLLSNDVSIFEKRMETLLFIKYIGKNEFIILKKNKKPITEIDKILNPIYVNVEAHFSKVRYLKRFKNYIFKIGGSTDSIRLHYIKDSSGHIKYDSDTLSEYSKLLKVQPIDYLYEGTLNAKEKNFLIENHIEKKSNLSSIIKIEDAHSFYNFGNPPNKTDPNDISVIIVSDFISFLNRSDMSILFRSEEKSKRYIQLITEYFIEYYKAYSRKFENLHFDNPNYTINNDLIDNQNLLEIFNKDEDSIIMYKIILGTFSKKIHPRGLYNEKDISNISKAINKINLKIKGLDFINTIK